MKPLLALFLIGLIVFSLSTKSEKKSFPQSVLLDKKELFYAPNDFRRISYEFKSWKLEDSKFTRTPNESELEFAARITSFIYQNSFHCNTFKHYIGPHSKTAVYGLLSPEFAPCGLCSQVNYWVNKILRNNNIESSLYGIEGHVVATLNVSDDYVWILDADYGIPPFLVKINDSDSMKRGAEIAYSAMLNHSIDAQKTYNKIISYYEKIDDDSFYDLDLLDEIYEDQKKFANLHDYSMSMTDNRATQFQKIKLLFVHKIAAETNSPITKQLLNEWYSS